MLNVMLSTHSYTSDMGPLAWFVFWSFVVPLHSLFVFLWTIFTVQKTGRAHKYGKRNVRCTVCTWFVNFCWTKIYFSQKTWKKTSGLLLIKTWKNISLYKYKGKWNCSEGWRRQNTTPHNAVLWSWPRRRFSKQTRNNRRVSAARHPPGPLYLLPPPRLTPARIYGAYPGHGLHGSQLTPCPQSIHT